MSIYATLWTIKLPADGQDYPGCEWVTVTAQAVPAHIGDPELYPDGDPYSSFLPPIDPESENRAVVIIRNGTPKGTERCHQEYPEPLLILTGVEYDRTTFSQLHQRLLAALGRGKPRLTMVLVRPDGTIEGRYHDGSQRILGQRDSPDHF